jgi:hypothetical protein
MDMTDIAEPKRENERRLNELPKCRKSRTARPDPRRPKLRSETALPRLT